jgi:hypothetical protein
MIQAASEAETLRASGRAPDPAALDLLISALSPLTVY